MKLYIPTSSLNFTNILSTESISPKAFYDLRDFGSKRFYSLECNICENSILLFDKFPNLPSNLNHTVANGRTLESNLMVIEIETADFDAEYTKTDNGVYRLDKTIYINPFSTKFYFVDESHKITALSHASGSAEVKLMKLYKNNIIIFGGELHTYNNISSSNFTINQQAISNDKKINRLRGFACSYIIGANSAKTENIALGQSIIKDIVDLSYAIVNSPTERGTYAQTNKIKELIESLAFVGFFEELNIEDPIKKLDLAKHSNNYHIVNYELDDLQYDLQKKETVENAIMTLNEWLQKCERSQTPLYNLDGIAFAGNKLTQFEDSLYLEQLKTREYYQIVINDILLDTEIDDTNFDSNKIDLATQITRCIKKYIETKDKNWGESKEKEYLNALRRSLNGQEEFTYFKGIGFISSLAAFFISGCNADKLADFLIRKWVYDGRLAWGLFGCVSGFASLSRMYTNKLFEINDINYLTKIYKTIFNQLHRIELKGELQINPTPIQTNTGYIASSDMNSNNTIGKRSEPTKYGGEDRSTKKTVLDSELKNTSSDSELIDKLKEVKISSSKIGTILQIYEKTESNWEKTFDCLKKSKVGIAEKTIAKIRLALGIDGTLGGLFGITSSSEDSDIVDSKVNAKLYNDDKLSSIVSGIIQKSPQKNRDFVEGDIKWFQKNYNDSYFDKDGKNKEGFYRHKSKDNQSVLTNLHKFLEERRSTKKDNMQWVKENYENIDIDSIISLLKSKYL